MPTFEYVPLSLDNYLNAGIDILNVKDPPIGAVVLRGLPFQIGAREAIDRVRTVVAVGKGFRRRPVKVSTLEGTRSVIVAHALLDSHAVELGTFGEEVAEYAFYLRSGTVVTVPIRELLEVATASDLSWGTSSVLTQLVAATAILGKSDQMDRLLPRYHGHWRDAGLRQKESDRGWPGGFTLWSWRVEPPDEIVAIELRPSHRPFVLGGITVGFRDEDPLSVGIRETIRMDLPVASKSDEETGVVEVLVDRGVSSYVRPLLGIATPSADSSEPHSDPADLGVQSSWAEISANPSATVTINLGSSPAVSFDWHRLLTRGNLQAGGVRVEAVDRDLSWVHTTVLDATTGRPVPCRIHFRSANGIPYQPHGHARQLDPAIPTWHVDVGGDLRVADATHAYIDGTCQGWLPVGDVLVEINRGPEYEPFRRVIQIKPGQRTLDLTLRRWIDTASTRWFSGDTHVHFLSVEGAHLEGSAEDLRVISLLQAQWGSLFTNVEDWSGRPSISELADNIVYVSQENRQHILGHLSLLGLRRPVMPFSTDGPEEAEIGGRIETTLSHWADDCHAQGGTVVVPHFPFPYGEAPALIASKRADAIELSGQDAYFHREYYRYLNAGFRLPVVAGTDKMSNEVAVGWLRTYVMVPDDEELSYASWCRNLARGRTFVAAGPVLSLSVDGAQIGDTVRLSRSGGSIEVHTRGESARPIHSLQLIVAGRVVAETVASGGQRVLELRDTVNVTKPTWIAARVGGDPNSFGSGEDARTGGPTFAHTSPIYIECGSQRYPRDADALAYMTARIRACVEYVRLGSVRSEMGSRLHSHGRPDHRAYLEGPLEEALRSLARLRRDPPLGEDATGRPA